MASVSDAIKTLIRTYAELDPGDEKMALIDLREQVSDLEEENRTLRAENAGLRAQLASRKKMERFGGACFILEDDGSETGPICPACYERDGIVMLLERANGGANCSRCGTRYAGVEPAVEGFRQYIG